ncbi:hypothetical protein RND81_12G189000 [Saponaria officinalis]|uniref:Uncharacterized protein n=1 Tax=Saponaria officinalis TaxID=3572 RepID=A0AAW1HCI1_SAPOF
MFMCYPSSPKKLAMTVGCFLFGVSLFAIGGHYAYKNIAPQQARTRARDQFVKDFLAKKYGYDWSKPDPYRRRRH